ncbi:MAG TPA: hypothetical protein VHD63_28900 [Ktedonobacteraceae bacterium]|jgi:hypothetical protein|nr:hypothetical protein [Ktedonobacteraceae bacterium]
MQHVQQREAGERISWARALIFGVGFFFIAALLIGQLPSFINSEMTASSLIGMEQGLLALAFVCLGGFLIVQAIVMLFDPKPVVPPAIFIGLGGIIAVLGTALIIWATSTSNQTIPGPSWSAGSVLGGKLLWFPEGSFDLVALGATALFVGVAWVFYGTLARREQINPDRRDLGSTPAIRFMLIAGTVLLIAFTLLFSFVSPDGLAQVISPSDVSTGHFWVNTVYNLILVAAIFCTLGAFALRLHYLMRPVRKNTMNGLYMIGVNLAPIGVVCLVAWFVLYPFVGWLHTLPGLGPFFTVCARKSAIPQSCAFSQEGGDLIGSVITTATFGLLMAAVWAWKTKRNLVVIGSVTTAVLLGLATLLTHIEYDPSVPYQATIALMLCGGALILATVWTNVARREFSVVGEKPLGCLGMWLLVGTSLFIYIAAFALFSIPGFHDTETNIPFSPGSIIGSKSQLDALVVAIIMGALAAIQFFFLVRNRYRV